MALTINGKLRGKAAQLDLQDQKLDEQARLQKFSREWKQSLEVLQYLMTSSEFAKFWDSYPFNITKREFLPIMQAKIDALMIGWNSAHEQVGSSINWHNRIIFDVSAMAENANRNSNELKARIDERMADARARMGERH